MTRRIAIVALALTGMMLAAAGADASPGDEALAQSPVTIAARFIEVDTAPSDLTIDPPATLSPFGGDSQLPPADLDRVTLDGIIDLVLSTASEPIPRDLGFDQNVDFPPGPVDRLDVDAAGTPSFTHDVPFPDESFVMPMTFPPGHAPETLEDLFVGLVPDPGVLVPPDTHLVGDDMLIVPSSRTEPFPLDGQPVLIRGARTVGDLPLDGCDGQQIELGTLDLVPGSEPWPAPAAPNDIFKGGSHAIVTRCTDGQWQPAEMLVNTGRSFTSRETATITLITPKGWLAVTPYSEVQGTTGTRLWAFTTDAASPYQPDTVGFTAFPEFPTLRPPTERTFLVDNPYPTAQSPDAVKVDPVIDFTNGTCEPTDFNDQYEVWITEGASGQAHTYMVQTVTGQVVEGDLLPGDSGFTGTLSGAGAGYEESYDWETGTYSHTGPDGSPCEWGFTVDPTALPAMLAAAPAAAPPPSPPPAPPSSAGSTSGDAASPGNTPPASPGEEPPAAAPISEPEQGGTPAWPFVLGAGGLLLIGAGGLTQWQRNRQRAAAAVASGRLPQSGLGTGDGILTLEDLQRYRSGDFTIEAPPANDMTEEKWKDYLRIETDLQERYLAELRSLFTDIVGRYNAYHAAITRFKERFVRILSGSTELQGYLRQWQENQQTAKKQDLAFAVITLVWGGVSLGLKGLRWLRAPKAAAAAEASAGRTLGTADGLVTGDTELAGAATATDGSRLPSQLDEAYKGYAAEVGVDADEWFARYGEAWEQAHEDLILLVAEKRGWHGISVQVEEVLNRLLVNGRSAVAGRGGTINPADVAKLREWASLGGFWNWLLTAGDLLEDGAILFYNVDDVRFLKALLECEGDVSALRPLLGPASTTGLTAAGGRSGLAGMAATDATGLTLRGVHSTSRSVASMLFQSGPLSGIDLSGYTDQFGGWISELDEGISSAVLSGTWRLFTSPFETFTSMTSTYGAETRYLEFLRGHRGDLLELSDALTDALGALDGLRNAIDHADLDDPKSPLGGLLAGQLRDLSGKMGDLLHDAPERWRHDHGDDVRKRREHIATKLADAERMLGALQDQLVRLGQMYEWLDGLRKDPEGHQRKATALWNPELLVRLAAVDVALKGVIGGALLGGSTPNPPSAPPDRRPAAPDPFSPEGRAEHAEQLRELFPGFETPLGSD